MAKRFQVNEYRVIYDMIAARDGEQCLLCGRKPPKWKLEIDHADNNPSNNKPENLHLLCSVDNKKMRQKPKREHMAIIRKRCAVCVSERERKQGYHSTHTVKGIIDYTDGSTEMKANSFFERKYREWLLQQIIKHEFIPRKEAINSGAEWVGCSPTTAGRYLDKMTSGVGNLTESFNDLGIKIVTFKSSRVKRNKKVKLDQYKECAKG